MDLPSSLVHRVLTENDVEELHHANTVLTACHFLRSKSLLSRGSVQRLGWSQTSQNSDTDDRRYSLWYDVFLDSVDIHARANRANAYGPVLFVFDTDILRKNDTGRLWVTKLNPTRWNDLKDGDRWFRSKKELEAGFVYGEFGQSIVLRHCGGAVPFSRFLKKIVLDDPDRQDKNGVDYFSMAVGALRSAMQYSGIDIEIERRECSKRCACSTFWSNRHRLSSMFDPL